MTGYVPRENDQFGNGGGSADIGNMSYGHEDMIYLILGMVLWSVTLLERVEPHTRAETGR